MCTWAEARILGGNPLWIDEPWTKWLPLRLVEYGYAEFIGNQYWKKTGEKEQKVERKKDKEKDEKREKIEYICMCACVCERRIRFASHFFRNFHRNFEIFLISISFSSRTIILLIFQIAILNILPWIDIH